MEQHKATWNGNGDRGRVYPGGPLGSAISDGSLAKEFISVAKNCEDAIGRTTFTDERQLNNVVALHRKLVKFHNTQGLATLTMWLNGRPAIGGYNRAQALMSGSGIVAPEALGVKLGKDSMKFIEKQVIAKASQGNNHQEGQNE